MAIDDCRFDDTRLVWFTQQIACRWNFDFHADDRLFWHVDRHYENASTRVGIDFRVYRTGYSAWNFDVKI